MSPFSCFSPESSIEPWPPARNSPTKRRSLPPMMESNTRAQTPIAYSRSQTPLGYTRPQLDHDFTMKRNDSKTDKLKKRLSLGTGTTRSMNRIVHLGPIQDENEMTRSSFDAVSIDSSTSKEGVARLPRTSFSFQEQHRQQAIRTQALTQLTASSPSSPNVSSAAQLPPKKSPSPPPAIRRKPAPRITDSIIRSAGVENVIKTSDKKSAPQVANLEEFWEEPKQLKAKAGEKKEYMSNSAKLRFDGAMDEIEKALKV